MSGERRKSFRVEWGNSAGKVDLGDDRPPRKCIVSNLSDGGAKISGVTAALPDEFRLTLVFDKKQTFPCRVRWRADNEVGVSFTDQPHKLLFPEDADLSANL